MVGIEGFLITIPLSPSIIIFSSFLKFFKTSLTPTIVGIEKDLATIEKCPSGPPNSLTKPVIFFFEVQEGLLHLILPKL